MIKAYWDKVEFTEDLRKENILFLENYVKILNFYPIHVENLKIENLPTKITLEDLSLDDSNSESYILIPKNNLSCIKLNLEYISNLFENEISVTEFKSLSLKTKIIIENCSMDDLAELNKLKEHFPEHSELAIDHFNTTK